jgi:N-acetylglucosaminyl-diphospho-decaprenol L-rhamnosyltransferase
VLVVSYNTRELTRRCIESVEAAITDAGVTGETLVLDNASTDGTADDLRRHPKVTLIESDVNLGFAAGVNRCAVVARGGLLLLCNPDSRLDARCISELVRARDLDPGAGFWGPRVTGGSGSVDLSTARRQLGLTALVAWATLLAPLVRRLGMEPEVPRRVRRATAPVPVDMLSGVVMLVDTEAWRALGGFDERFFMYGEDADLCRRARMAGWRPQLVPAALVHHEVGASSSSTRREMLKLAGRCTYVHRHFGGVRRRAALAAIRAGVAIRSLVGARAGSVDWRSVHRSSELWRDGYHEESIRRRAQLERLGVSSRA